jgi:short subunit dehydrogenase-like uncharacterized protein
VFSCGFDSIPFDLGVLFLQDEARRRFGEPLCRVRAACAFSKAPSPAARWPARWRPSRRQVATTAVAHDGRSLCADAGVPRSGTARGDSATYDEAAKSWTGHFVMAAINTKNVHRTNALRGHPWGRDFVYDERMLTGDGDRGELRAKGLARSMRMQNMFLGWGLTRELLRRFALPKPGQGPSREQRERGRDEVEFIGDTAQGQRRRATVRGDRDPGYGSTCKLVAESALCLAGEIARSMTPGGVWTPGAAMGMALVRRLHDRAGLNFAIED